jgi:hypothetical protein
MGEKELTASDVFYLVLLCFVLVFLTNIGDSCVSQFRYRDLRDRLERLEKR